MQKSVYFGRFALIRLNLQRKSLNMKGVFSFHGCPRIKLSRAPFNIEPTRPAAKWALFLAQSKCKMYGFGPLVWTLFGFFLTLWGSKKGVKGKKSSLVVEGMGPSYGLRLQVKFA